MKTLRQARKERLAQRMSTVPRKVTQADSLYDRVLALAEPLATVAVSEAETYKKNDDILKAVKAEIEKRINEVNSEMNIDDFRDMLRELWDKINETSLEYMDLDYATDIANDLKNIANEIKQVALDTHGGTTSPTDIGNWLY